MNIRMLRDCRSLGFTLLEVALAVLILSASLVIMLGLQSSSMRRSYEDRRRQEAMLLARQVLAALESRKEPLPAFTTTGTVEDILREAYDDSNAVDRDPDPQRLFEATLAVEDFGIPDVDDKALKRVYLNMAWGRGPFDSIEVYYFIPNLTDEYDPGATDGEEG